MRRERATGGRRRRGRPLLLTVVGARPQFVKVAPLARAFRKPFRHVLVHTGQHYDPEMSASFFEDLSIPEPDHHLGVRSGTHGAMTGRMLEALERVLLEVAPDMVVVVGDTNSTLAGALAAAKLGIPVAHVEAGLRSFDERMPEELNRRLTDHLSRLLFCPTHAAVDNLRREGITRGVFRVGDVMLDALQQQLSRARRRELPHGLAPGDFYLATIHRQENADDPARLASILCALEQLPRPVLLPLHPRTRTRLSRLRRRPAGALVLSPPLPYLTTLRAIAGARGVLTDSGGMQKEAFVLGTPCVTLRDTSEWVETLEAKANTLTGADPRRIAAAVRRIERGAVRVPSAARRYGGGRAAQRIARKVAAFLGRGR